MKKAKKSKDFVHRAYYKGGSEALKDFVKNEMCYPPEAKKNGIQGAVKLKFEIDHLGNVHHVKVLSGLGYGCDEEAIRIAELLKFQVPKTYKLKVGFQKKLNIHFRLKKEQKKLPKPKGQSTTYTYTISKSKKDDQPRPPQKGYSYVIKL